MDADFSTYAQAAAFIGAALAIGMGTIGPAIAQGMIGKTACEGIGKYPESYSKIRTTMLISMGIVETAAIYAFIVSLLLIFLNLPK